MAETFKFDERAALAKLDAVEKAHREVVGKANYNPFFVINKVEKLRAQVKRGVATPELQAEINQLSAVPVPLVKEVLSEVKPEPKPTLPPPTSNAGLKLPVK